VRTGIFILMLLSAQAAAQNSPKAAIAAGNQAWIDGMKSGDAALISATYTSDGIDCGPTGECFKGRAEIERHVKAQLVTFGRARSATVRSQGSTQQGDFVYEWGQAEATFDGGKKLVDNYLTAWQEQPDGGWKIFRNMVIPVN
jgi:ketosteroid isomerase-like protein